MKARAITLGVLLTFLLKVNLLFAQFGELNLGLIPAYHFPHSDVLGDFKPGMGVYFRAHMPENNFFAEVGYVKFQPKQAIYFEENSNGKYSLSYSNYSAIPVSVGYLIPIIERDHYIFSFAPYAGYWYNFYDYNYVDEFHTQNGVTGISKFQLGLLLNFERKYKDFRFGTEMRYGGLIPLRLGWQNTAYEGIIVIALKASYNFD